MPWTPEEFKKKHAKHAKHLTDHQAEMASRIADAILGRTGDEGLAIATGIARAKAGPTKKKKK